MNKTDINRWKKTSKETPTWDERNKLLVEFIPKGSSVIDVGCGSMAIRDYLPEDCEYQPVDCVQGSDETLIAEFNTGNIPEINKVYDYAICSGVLEYINSPPEFMNIVSGWANKIFLSYAILEYHPDIQVRRNAGWFNDLDIVGLDNLIHNAGLAYRIRATWQGQLIYEIYKQS